jgi:CubicO group peptidase (beta-lactamase class C family)
MKLLRLYHPLCLSALMALILISGKPAQAQSSPDAEKSKAIREFLNEIVSKEKLPGMIAAIADADGLIAIGSAGVRKEGSKDALTDKDLFHIGSCTKAMTSTLLATLVADGSLRWDSTLIEVLPELKKKIHSDYHDVTLWQLVSHRAGFPANASNWWVHDRMKLKKRRLAILDENLDAASAKKAGDFFYSNLGYMAAGCMAEKVSGATWEALIKKRLFDPVGMKSAGFGPPGRPKKTEQPWGHDKSNGKWQPKQFDNAEALGPAGRVHCTIEDWAKFIALQFPDNKSSVLDRAALTRLIQPDGDYAGGWKVVKRSWANGTALTHSGSNTMWYAVVWAAPGLNRSFIVITNSRDDQSAKICDDMIGKLMAIDKKP